jgi:hypothetical protein
MLEVLLAEFAAMSSAQRLAGTKFLGDGSGDGAPDKNAVARLFHDTKMVDADARSAVFAAGKEATRKSDDPLLVLARGLAAERADAGLRQRQRGGKMLDVGRRWIAAQEAFRGKAFYPDANSTLRVSIAEVAG